jgi:RHS repeat-associated protein
MRMRVAAAAAVFSGTVIGGAVGAHVEAASCPGYAVPHTGWRDMKLSFDGTGRLQWWSSAATGRETRRLDDAGRTLERRFANGDIWSYRYGEHGRPTELVAASASGALRTTIAWRQAFPVRIDHPHENETRRYDSQGRLAGRVVHRKALTPDELEYTYRENFEWNAANRLLRHDLPEGGSLLYAHDAHGRLTEIQWQEGNRRQLLLATPQKDGYAHGNGIRVRGLLRGERLEVLGMDDPAMPDAPPLLCQRLRYDQQGRIAGEHLQTGAWHANWSYAYGADAGMTGAAVRLHGMPAPVQHTWMYAWRTSGAGLAARQDTRTHRPVLGRDSSGLPRRADGRHLHYGPDRRLQSVWENGRELARYAHNAHGERIRRYTAAGTRHYLYAHNRIVAEVQPLPGRGMGVTRRYVYAGWTAVAVIEYPRPRPLALKRHAAGTPVFHAIHTDAMGMPRVITDADRRVRWRALWTPTGGLLATQGDVAMPLRQPGHFHDDATGWHDNSLRTYDPRAGHYLEPDPAGPGPDTQPFGYAAQQPRRQAVPPGRHAQFGLPGMDNPGMDNRYAVPSGRAGSTWMAHAAARDDGHVPSPLGDACAGPLGTVVAPFTGVHGDIGGGLAAASGAGGARTARAPNDPATVDMRGYNAWLRGTLDADLPLAPRNGQG